MYKLTLGAVILVFFTCILLTCANFQPQADQKGITAVPFTQVKITDAFWKPRLENNRSVTIPTQLAAYAEKGRLPSAKLIEAVAYTLATHPDPQLKDKIETVIDKMITRYLPGGKPREWKNLLNGELYGAGHFFEAAVAYYLATDDSKMLEAARILADDIDSNFGPNKRREVSQHEEVKIGLVKLYRFTGEEKYLKLAKFFLDERGQANSGRQLYGEYAQDHTPVIQQAEAVGHTVRASYLYTSLADMALLTGEAFYQQASKRIWEDVVFRKIYLTGHIGSHRDHEDFGDPYVLPNISGWNETCASIGSIFWNHRLFLLNGDAQYVDMLERILYNGVLVGVSLDGEGFFYQNPLRTMGGFERQPWFGPNCCPPNVARLLASLGDYIYAQNEDSIYVNLFIGSEVRIQHQQQTVILTQETQYPWDGHIRVTVQTEHPTDCSILLRIPGWNRNAPVPGDLYRYQKLEKETFRVRINGQEVTVETEKGYVRLRKEWQSGDVIELALPMPVRRILAHTNVADNLSMVALERGPLVYCAEGIDNDNQVMNLLIPEHTNLSAEFHPDLLEGVSVITGNVTRFERDPNQSEVKKEAHKLVAVPYFSWANRGETQMSVWLAQDISRSVLPPKPTLASTSRVSSSCGTGSVEDNYPGGSVPSIATRFFPRAQSGAAGLEVIFDQVTPVDSADGSHTYLRLRPQSGDKAWVQYDFRNPTEVSQIEVYWKDDKEYCQIPRSWRLLYRSANTWHPVENSNPYGVERDTFNRVTFTPLTTDGIRLEITMQGLTFQKGDLGPPDANYLKEDTIWYEGGLIEWRVK